MLTHKSAVVQVWVSAERRSDRAETGRIVVKK
jgi:hypothetical protein